MTLFTPNPSDRRPSPWATASLLAHAAFLAAILFHHPISVSPMKLPGDDHGHRLTLTYVPGRAAPQASIATPLPPRPTPATISPIHTAKAAPLAATSTSPGSSNSTAAQGTDALGNGNVTVALATFFPRPAPNLSDLPAHTRGDVVVDIIIDATGKITDTKVAQSLGATVDQTVLATIQTWTFKPATRDGVPVASEQELLFHYERG